MLCLRLGDAQPEPDRGFVHVILFSNVFYTDASTLATRGLRFFLNILQFNRGRTHLNLERSAELRIKPHILGIGVAVPTLPQLPPHDCLSLVTALTLARIGDTAPGAGELDEGGGTAHAHA